MLSLDKVNQRASVFNKYPPRTNTLPFHLRHNISGSPLGWDNHHVDCNALQYIPKLDLLA